SPVAALLKLRHIPSNHGLIAGAHEFWIALNREECFYSCANSFDDLFHIVDVNGAKVVYIPELAALGRKPQTAHKIAYVNDGAFGEIAYSKRRGPESQLNLNGPL